MKLWGNFLSFFKKIFKVIRRYMNTSTSITFPGQNPSTPFTELELLSGTAYIEYIVGIGICIVIHAGGRITYLSDSAGNRTMILGYMPIYEKHPVFKESDGDGLKNIVENSSEIEIRNERKKKYPSLKM